MSRKLRTLALALHSSWAFAGAAAALGLVATLLLAGCGDTTPHEPPCGNGEFLYEDQLCGWTSDQERICEDRGDGLCYTLCDNDFDCGGGTRCSLRGLFAGGDYYCNDWVFVCADREDTPCISPGR